MTAFSFFSLFFSFLFSFFFSLRLSFFLSFFSLDRLIPLEGDVADDGKEEDEAKVEEAKAREEEVVEWG